MVYVFLFIRCCFYYTLYPPCCLPPFAYRFAVSSPYLRHSASVMNLVAYRDTMLCTHALPWPPAGTPIR
ncbi:hypothetical protein M407DRAFT_138804 [Tulasnella calospora MUT 4182]|uniref:Secreted protein n=1 Tax=Tulasnella calospora MUT 4182 TaxID=1051891 RepID=A0A0C3QSV2_9AGAM|nr:hypothetical protein M407DRAFT_138804 [Tulasnella calospora MUT 4182]